ncbi:hypothetical protein PGAG_00205 [Phaeocystis globosa virus 12T]|uniref:Uncharacterized protein n=1 Tax=Phaeocystis globosa virus PgV-16T TaxID=3071227 RepID=A0AC59EX78_9VIRU|nr:hypothetical protein PGCG_00245 [Phaeocystis globosa virus]AET73094.1 hypothetical protein PGAG_00205 [Phaeocystis globosa virus 12T]AET73916.1 hypothetical protein PGBG_00208 [Phaeocystis globosa virus 14T]AGM15556.1 hypothetical protein PGCG_00245 [Phaeocystis globosa virus PgV-16T]UYE94286.1 hypothetical protein PGV14T_00245 [Phaeocystis globosa virus]
MKVSNIIIITTLVLLIVYLSTRFLFVTDIIYDIMCDAKVPANSDSASTLTGSLLAVNKNIIANKDFNENNTSNLMISGWFFVDNWGNEISNEKNILYVSTTPNSITPADLKNKLVGISSSVEALSDPATPYKNLAISLDKYENNLLIDIETYSDSVENKTTFTRYLIKNIPIQKWNNITISIDTKTMDVYLDGKLRNSFILHGIYKNKYENNAEKNIYLGNLGGSNVGFEGYITRIRYQPHSINPQEANNIYKAGISASLAKTMYNKYGLKVSFMEHDNERGSFTI